MLLDQLLFSPVFLAVFFIYNHISERGRLDGLTKRFDAVHFAANSACADLLGIQRNPQSQLQSLAAGSMHQFLLGPPQLSIALFKLCRHRLDRFPLHQQC